MRKVSATIICLCIVSISAFSQSKSFISKIDTTFDAFNKYISEYSTDDYYSSGIGDQEFNVFEYDTQLLNAAIFFALNRERASGNKDLFKYDPNLSTAAFNYVLLKSRKRLEDTKANNDKLAKDFPGAGSLFSFYGKLQNFNIGVINAIRYKKGKAFFYNKKDENTLLKLYYGDKKDKNKEHPPLEFMNYNEFAVYLLHLIDKKNLRSKAYEYVGCYAMIDPATLNRRRIPQARVMIIYGGFRLKEIE